MGSLGTSTFFARQDHQHSHGFLTNSLLHATATTSASGFLSNIDKAFIDGLPASITASFNSISGTSLDYTSGTFDILSATYLSATHENINGDLILTGNFWLSGNINSFNNYNREVWVVPYSASAEANGSKFNPFNPVSAQAVGASGPINQAAHHLMNISNANAQQENSPKIIHLYQGRYDENITISGSEPYEILYNGNVRFGNIAGAAPQNQFTCTKITTPLTYSSIGSAIQFGILREMGSAFYGSWNYGGPLILATTGSVTTVCYLENTTFDSISSSLCTGSVVLSQQGGNYRGRVNFTGTSAIIKEVDFSQAADFSGSNPVRLFEKCIFRAPLTLSMGYTSLPAGLSRGFLACEFRSGFTFSGPTGSAQFDQTSYRNFQWANGVFVGGASTGDMLLPTLFASGNYTNFTASNFTASTISSLILSSSYITSSYISSTFMFVNGLDVGSLLAQIKTILGI